MKVEDDSIASRVLRFYKENRIYFDPYEPTRSEQFYTLDYHDAYLRAEYNQIIHGKALRYFVYLMKY